MNGGDDGARTRDLCRDRTNTNHNPLILKRTDGSESAQKHPKTPFSTLLAPSEQQKSRGQKVSLGNLAPAILLLRDLFNDRQENQNRNANKWLHSIANGGHAVPIPAPWSRTVQVKTLSALSGVAQGQKDHSISPFIRTEVVPRFNRR